MISAWWLLLIVPVAGCIGYLMAALCWISKEADTISRIDKPPGFDSIRKPYPWKDSANKKGR